MKTSVYTRQFRQLKNGRSLACSVQFLQPEFTIPLKKFWNREELSIRPHSGFLHPGYTIKYLGLKTVQHEAGVAIELILSIY
jgi:hypothetical protein